MFPTSKDVPNIAALSDPTSKGIPNIGQENSGMGYPLFPTSKDVPNIAASFDSEAATSRDDTEHCGID